MLRSSMKAESQPLFVLLTGPLQLSSSFAEIDEMVVVENYMQTMPSYMTPIR